MSDSEERRRPGPRGPRPLPPLPIEAVWVEGPRTEAWNELWRRLLEVVMADCDCADRETPAESPGTDVGDQSLSYDQGSSEVE